MKISAILSLLGLLALTNAQDCSEYQSRHSFLNDGIPITLDYVVTVDEGSAQGGLFRAQVTYEGQGWLALGFSPTGTMAGSLAVVGLPDDPLAASNPGKVLLPSYNPSLANDLLADNQQTLMDHSIVQNDTHTVLTFSKYLTEEGEVAIDPQGNNFILVAAGFSNTFSYHEHRASVSLNLQPCGGATTSDAMADTTTTTTPPTGAPTQAATTTQPTQSTTTVANEASPSTGEDELVDCSEFQASHEFDVPITIDYVVNEDDSSPNGGIFRARVTYEGLGWLAAGFSTNGRMIGSLAVIGLPDQPESASNPRKYNLGAFDPSGVTLTGQQTLMDSTVSQNGTHTVLTFSKFLKEDGEIAIDPSGTNFILVAAGSSNTLGFHAHRASVGLALQPCQEGQLASQTNMGGGAVTTIEFDDKKRFFKAHGFMAAIAWGVLAPLAISNSMCRHLIPVQGLWFEMHRGLNMLVGVMTLICFALVVKALEDTSGGHANHFQPRDGAIGKHHTIGLVVFLLVIVQCIAGILRPHTPAKGERPTALRVMWEYGHKLCGVTLLAMGWYQCHTGLIWYAQRFGNDEDYTGVFWGITGTIAAIGFAGKIHGIVTLKPDEPDDTETPKHNPTENDNDPSDPEEPCSKDPEVLCA